MATLHEIDRAIDCGLSYLQNNRTVGGYLFDFSLPNGTSDTWVSALVLWALVSEGIVTQWMIELTDTIRRRANSGFTLGYNLGSPADCDTLAWVYRLLCTVADSKDHYTLRKLRAQIDQHMTATGGFRTFVNCNVIARFTNKPVPPSWVEEHGCTSISVLTSGIHSVATDRNLLERLESILTPFWYPDNTLTLFQLYNSSVYFDAVEAFRCRTNSSLDPLVINVLLVQRAIAGSRTDLHVGSERLLQYSRVVDAILEAQNSSGSWPPFVELQLPLNAQKADRMQKSKYRTIRSHNSIIETAIAINTLAKVKKVKERAIVG